jgi:hypothetical protein
MTTIPKPKPIPTFTTPHLLELTGLTRRQLQHMEEAGALTAHRKGRGGPGRAATWTVMQAVAAAYGKAFLDAGCHPTWAYAAAAWVAARHQGELAEALAQGRTLLALAPDGQSRLVEPYLKPGATREQRIAVAQLNLRAVQERLLRRAEELGVRDGVRAREAWQTE